jgi:hypothetical protein
MTFVETVKIEAKRKAHYRCCACESTDFLDVHHITPQNEGGDDSIDNAVALCKKCHDIYGSNPDKRKWIKERRDFWYEFCEKKLHGEKIENLDRLNEIIEIAKKDNKHALKLPIEGPSESALFIAQKYWESSTESKSMFILLFLIPLVISIIIIQDYWFTKVMNNLILSSVFLIIPVYQLFVVSMRVTSSCPNCKKGFAISEVGRELIDKSVVGKKRIENHRVFDGCRFCDFRRQWLDVKEIELDNR